MITIPLKGFTSPDRILIPQNTKILLEVVEAVANPRQITSDVIDIRKSIISIQHKLNIAMYQAALTCTLKADDFTIFNLHRNSAKEPPKASEISYKMSSYSMINYDEYVMALTFFVETFSATVFSLLDVAGSLINHLYKLGIKDNEVDFKKSIWELQNQKRIEPTDDVFRFLISYSSSKRHQDYEETARLREVTWMNAMKQIRNRTTHRPITDVCEFHSRGDIYTSAYQGHVSTEFFISHNLLPSTKLSDFVEEVFAGIELFVEELYFYLSEAIKESGTLPIY